MKNLNSIISIEALAEKLNGKVWIKGEMKRIYLDRGYNTKKMSTKTFVAINEDGSYKVSCFIECDSQPLAWIKSQQNDIVEGVTQDIEDIIAELEPATQEAPAVEEVEFVGDRSLLENYLEALARATTKEEQRLGTKYICRVEAEGQLCRTIWLPSRTSNRTVTMDLNHEIIGFDEKGLWGANGNCGTSYIIIDAPLAVTDEDREAIGIEVNKRLGNKYPQWYNAMRASEAKLVRQVAYEMYGNN